MIRLMVSMGINTRYSQLQYDEADLTFRKRNEKKEQQPKRKNPSTCVHLLRVPYMQYIYTVCPSTTLLQVKFLDFERETTWREQNF